MRAYLPLRRKPPDAIIIALTTANFAADFCICITRCVEVFHLDAPVLAPFLEPKKGLGFGLTGLRGVA